MIVQGDKVRVQVREHDRVGSVLLRLLFGPLDDIGPPLFHRLQLVFREVAGLLLQ